ncbi:MAG: lysophospholipid acyltransferase family protein [Lentisphaerae bacterium]|nr:lysophospholipid acyltransferase family protein [Lentisphaerota bacterium]
MRKPRPIVKNILEYIGARCAMAVVDSLSLPAAERVARGVADAWFALGRSRRRIAIRNILRAGITADPRRAAAIARASFRHFGYILAESLKSGEVFTETNWRDRMELQIHPDTMALFETPDRGVILVSGHFGNWELAAQLLSHVKPLVGVTRRMNNPLADRLVQKRKPRNRFSLTPKHDTDIRRLIGTLKDGHILALMIDQHAPRERGIPAEFFGHPASTHRSAALLHLVTGAPLCFAYSVRLGLMRYRLVAEAPLTFTSTGDKEADTRCILETLNRRLEAAIRANPEQYLWAHRRWKL